MRAQNINSNILTQAWFCSALFLTFILFVFADCSKALAFNENGDSHPDTSAYGRTTYNANSLVDQDRAHRINLMVDYAKQQVPHLTPGLPAFLRDPRGWITSGLGSSGLNGDNAPDGISSFLQPVQSALHEPSVDAPQALWITPAYHHKGFLPVNDAMIMGFHVRHSLENDFAGHNLQFDVHPFYGQNWRSTDNYWGTEVAFNLRAKDAVQPWGKIALRFTNGDTELMDHGHGFDMHSQLNFDEHLSLNAGIRENGNSAAGNYVMMRWKLLGGD